MPYCQIPGCKATIHKLSNLCGKCKKRFVGGSGEAYAFIETRFKLHHTLPRATPASELSTTPFAKNKRRS